MSRGVLIAPPRYAPQIATDPPEEREGREHINLLITLACLHVYRFSKAVSLIRHCEPLVGPDFGVEPADWCGIAARDAAMSVYHFGETRRAISSSLGKCPSLNAQVDAEKLRAARKAFDREFPDAVQLRHAIGHLAEQLSTPQKMAKLKRAGEFLIWESQVGGSLSMASPKGRQVRLNVDEQTLDRLQTILVTICEAFDGASPTWSHACG